MKRLTPQLLIMLSGAFLIVTGVVLLAIQLSLPNQNPYAASFDANMWNLKLVTNHIGLAMLGVGNPLDCRFHRSDPLERSLKLNLRRSFRTILSAFRGNRSYGWPRTRRERPSCRMASADLAASRHNVERRLDLRGRCIVREAMETASWVFP